jgi:hypothetical protein
LHVIQLTLQCHPQVANHGNALAISAAPQVLCVYPHSSRLPRQRRAHDIGGILYCNDGDWAEHQSVLVEDLSGELRLADRREIIIQSGRDELCEETAQAER